VRQGEQTVELHAAEAALFAGRLDFDNAARPGQDKVGIGLGGGVLFVIKVQNRGVLEHAARDGRDLIGQGVGLEHPLLA